MKSRLSIAASIAAALAALGFVLGAAPLGARAAGGAADPAPTEVRFAPGTSSALLSGSVYPGHAVTYSLSAVAGQTMSIEVSEARHCCLAPIDVRVPGGTLTDDKNRRKQAWTGTIRTTGSFEIVLRDGKPDDHADYWVSIAIFDPSAPRGIEQYDFENGTVVVDKRTVQLKNGRMVRTPQLDPEFGADIDELPAFGFVDGYPDELALVFVGSSDGGTGVSQDLDLFAMRAGKRVLVADLQGGDRADGGFDTARFDGGYLVVEVYAPRTPSGPACCPGFVDTVRYRFAGGKLVRAGVLARRKAYQDKDY